MVSSFAGGLVPVESIMINKTYENITFQVLQVPKEGPPRFLSRGSVRTKRGVSFERGVNSLVSHLSLLRASRSTNFKKTIATAALVVESEDL